MAEQVLNNDNKTEDISLYGLFSLFFRNWLILCVSGFSFAIITLIWAINQPNVYKAETILMSVDAKNSSLGGLAGQFGGLASLAGVNLPDAGNDNTKLAIELMQSRYFISKFVERYDLTVPIMASKSWDISTNTLVLNEDVYDEKTKKWVRTVKAPRQQIPSGQEVYHKFITMMDVDQDPKTKFVTLSIEFYSPEIAAKWTRDFVNMINEEIREKDKLEAEESINYLQDLISNSNVAELRNVFSKLMEEQIKSKMLAEVRQNYVFKVVDPAIAPENKSKPKRALIIIAGGILGGIIGIIIILYRSGRKQQLLK